uniref:Uncharacterized protein n=1 Tax=Glossina pallidipes TaxID=7398 RepID=A0A1A9Z6A1_GLOPL
MTSESKRQSAFIKATKTKHNLIREILCARNCNGEIIVLHIFTGGHDNQISVTTQHTLSHWFANSRIDNLNLANDPRGRPESKLNNDVLNVTVEFDSLQSAYELSLNNKSL